MADTVPSTIVRKIRDRQTLLWVCQRYDLTLDAEPHGYDLPPTEAALIYRSEVNAADRAITARYWEAVWLEGAQSPLLIAMRQTAEKQETEHRRPVVVLKEQADVEAQVSTQEFLPVSVLLGLLYLQAVPEARYGRRSEGRAFSRRDFWRDTQDPTQPRRTQIRVSRWITEWRAEGYIDDLQQTVPLRPRHFNPPSRIKEIVPCIIRFEFNGPLAVPPRFVEGGGHHAQRDSSVAS
jgi:hypothetical protein